MTGCNKALSWLRGIAGWSHVACLAQHGRNMLEHVVTKMMNDENMWKPSIWISYEHPMESAGSLFLFFSQTLRTLRWDMVTLTQDLDMPWPASKKDWKQIGLQLQVTNHLWINTWQDVNLRDLRKICTMLTLTKIDFRMRMLMVPLLVPWWCHCWPNSAPKFSRIETWYDLIPESRRKRCGMTLGNLHRRQQMLEATLMLFLIGLAGGWKSANQKE